MARTVKGLNKRNRRGPQQVAVDAKVESLERRRSTVRREMTVEIGNGSLTELQIRFGAVESECFDIIGLNMKGSCL